MTVEHNAVITCNQCGKTQTMKLGSSLMPYWGAPGGWLTVNSIDPYGFRLSAGADTPEQSRQKPPDLCSWRCVSEYAADEAGIMQVRKSVRSVQEIRDDLGYSKEDGLPQG